MTEKKEASKETENKNPDGPFNLEDLPIVKCICGGMLWEYAIVLRRLDTPKTGPKNVPIDAVQCKKCGSILQDGVPILRKPVPQIKSK